MLKHGKTWVQALAIVGLVTSCSPPDTPVQVSLSGLLAHALPGDDPVPLTAIVSGGRSGLTWRYIFSDDCQGRFSQGAVGPTTDVVATTSWQPPRTTTPACHVRVDVQPEGDTARAAAEQVVRIAYVVRLPAATGGPEPCARPSHNTIGGAIADPAVLDGSLIDLCPGTYAENLAITRSLTLSALSSPGSVVLRPKAAPPTGAIIEVGDTTDGAAQTPRVDISGVQVDGSLLVPAAPPVFRGISFRPGASGSVSHGAIIAIKPSAIGVQNGYAIVVNRASVDIQDNDISDFGKNALTIRSLQEPHTINFRNNRVTGIDPTQLGTQLSQNGVVYRDGASGDITGNVFTNLGPSGAANAKLGDARVATDATVGYAILLLSSLSSDSRITAGGNTFTNVQGILYDERGFATAAQKATALFAEAFLSTNTITSGRYFTYGPPSEATVIAGARDDDLNQLNYVLSDFDCSTYSSCTVALGGPSSYTLTSKLVNPPTPLMLVSRGGGVTLSFPGTLPGNLRAGPGVTLSPR